MMSTNHTVALFTVSLAACFNAGPPATIAAEATPIFAITPPPVHDDCGNSYFIGSVAIASDSGPSYLTLVPYEGENCNDNGGGSGNAAAILSFDKTRTAFYTANNNGGGGTNITCPSGNGNNGGGNFTSGFLGGSSSQCIALAGDTSTPPRVLANGEWVAGPINNGQGSGPFAFGTTTTTTVVQADVSNLTPAGVVFDANSSTIYFAAWPISTNSGNSGGNFDHDNPQYPGDASAFARSSNGGGYGLLSMSATAVGQGTVVPANVLSQTIQFFGESIENSLVSNDTDLFFISHSAVAQDGATIGTFPKNGTSSDSASAIATLDQSLSPDIGPVGLAADNNNIVWTGSVDVHQYPEVGCWVFSLPTNAASGTKPTSVFSTTKFSCTDAALDSSTGDIYFAIVSLDSDGNEMHGDGIGRVPLNNPNNSVESIAVGMVGDGAGPRRIYLDDASIYAVDPEVLGKIDKHSLDGKHDF